MENVFEVKDASGKYRLLAYFTDIPESYKYKDYTGVDYLIIDDKYYIIDYVTVVMSKNIKLFTLRESHSEFFIEIVDRLKEYEFI